MCIFRVSPRQNGREEAHDTWFQVDHMSPNFRAFLKLEEIFLALVSGWFHFCLFAVSFLFGLPSFQLALGRFSSI